MTIPARTAFRCGLCAVAAVVVLNGYGGPSLFGQSGTIAAEWRYHGGDPGSTKYSPLDQINRDNVKSLRIAWRWKTENFGPAPDYNFQVTPLMARGVLYTTAGWRRNVAAIDPATGETLWMFRYDEGRRGQNAPVRPAAGRGLAYWTDGTNERILYLTRGYHLIELDAKTGHLVPTFGTDGVVDLYDGLDQPRPPSWERAFREQPRVPGCEDRKTGLAFSDEPSRHLGLRLASRAEPGGHQRERTSDQGRCAGDETRIHVCFRSCDRSTGLADRGTSRAAVGRGGREDVADAAVSHEAAPIR